MARPNAGRKHEIEKRRTEVARLYGRNQTQSDFARKLGISRSAIAKDLIALHQEWKKERIGDREDWINRELRRIDQTERWAQNAWHRSKKEYTKRTAKTDGQKKNLGILQTENRDGDPRFLEIILRCVNSRIELLGLKAPVRTELSGPNGGPMQMQQEVPASPEQIEELKQRLLARLGYTNAQPVGTGPDQSLAQDDEQAADADAHQPKTDDEWDLDG
jgi:hypothetical protein